MIDAQHGNSIELGVPQVYALRPNFPNPFTTTTGTLIRYAVPREERVRLRVFDVRGRVVKELVNKNQMPGWYDVQFGGRDVAAGVYFYRLDAGDYREQHKMVIIK